MGYFTVNEQYHHSIHNGLLKNGTHQSASAQSATTLRLLLSSVAGNSIRVCCCLLWVSIPAGCRLSGVSQ